MRQYIFEKITVRQICEGAGVIRATFYNYFEDKYDCLNAIVYHDLAEEALSDLSEPVREERIAAMLEKVDKHRDFYRMAYNVTGQDSFEDMVSGNLSLVFEEEFFRYRDPSFLPKYPDEMLADYYAQSLGYMIRQFAVCTDPAVTPARAAHLIITMMETAYVSLLKK